MATASIDASAALEQRSLALSGSGGGIDNPVAPWLGQPERSTRFMTSDRLQVGAYNLMAAYEGRSLFLRDTIDGFIMEDNEWQTTVCLPWAYTEEMNIVWNEWKFNRPLVGRAAHQGTVRMITSSKSTKRASLIRRGLGFNMEWGFWQTPEGQEAYARNLLGIRSAVQETMNYDVLNELRHAHAYDQKYRQQMRVERVDINALLRIERARTAKLQKAENPQRAFEDSLDDTRATFQRWSTVPDLIITHPKFRQFYSQVDPQRTSFWTYGADGVLMQKLGPMAVTTIRNAAVFENRLLDANDAGVSVDMLSHRAQHGEYFKMADQYMGSSHDGYQAHWLDTYIFDEDDDGAYARIRVRDMFMASMRFTGSGELSPLHDTLAQKGTAVDPTSRSAYGSTYEAASSRVAGYADPQRMADYDMRTNKRGLIDMFLHYEDGEYHVCRTLGSMDRRYANDGDVVQMAMTAAQRVFGDRDMADAAFATVRRLINTINAERVTPLWIAAIKAANADAAGAVPTTQTSKDVTKGDADKPRLPTLPEMQGNQFGGLRIPRRDPNGLFANMAAPALYGNYPGIATLASQDGQGWDVRVKEAQLGVQVIDHAVAVATRMFPRSPLIQAKYRSPWFGSATYGAHQAFFENIIDRPRPAVFINVGALGALNDNAGAPDAEVTGILGGTDSPANKALAELAPGNADLLKAIVVNGGGSESAARGAQRFVLGANMESDAAVKTQLVAAYVAYSSGDSTQAQTKQVKDAVKKIKSNDTTVLKAPEFPETLRTIAGVQGSEWVRAPLTATPQFLRDIKDDVAAPDVTTTLTATDQLVPAGTTLSSIAAIGDVRTASNTPVVFTQAGAADAQPVLTDAALQVFNWMEQHPQFLGDSLSSKHIRHTTHAQYGLHVYGRDAASVSAGLTTQGQRTAAYDAQLRSGGQFNPRVASFAAQRQEQSARRAGEGLAALIGSDSSYATVGAVPTYNDIDTIGVNIMAGRSGTAGLPVVQHGGMDWHHDGPLDAAALSAAMSRARTPNHFVHINHNTEMRWAATSKIASSLVRYMARLWITSENHWEAWDAQVSNDVLPLVSFIGFRPWITHQWYDYIYMRGGYETGATFYGHSSVAVSNDAISKMMYAAWHAYLKALVFRPRNVANLRNTFSCGYHGGNGSTFFTSSEQMSLKDGNHSADIIATMQPYRWPWSRRQPAMIDVTGTTVIGDVPLTDEQLTRPDHASASFYELKWGIRRAYESRRTAASASFIYSSGNSAATLCAQGHQVLFNKSDGLDGSFSLVVTSRGVFGPNGEGDDAVLVRAGLSSMGFSDKNGYANVRLPV